VKSSDGTVSRIDPGASRDHSTTLHRGNTSKVYVGSRVLYLVVSFVQSSIHCPLLEASQPKMISLLPLLAVAPMVFADWSGNVNYNSPSRRHPGLGIHMPKVLKRQSSPSYMDAGRLNFTHGIASGDPYSDSVILWTRVAPTSDNDLSNVTVSGTVPLYNHNTEEYVEASSNPICVNYVVSESEDLSDPVTDGKAYTSSDIDYTVKVEAKDLRAFTSYYYQFSVCDSDVKSPIGRTKTAPAADDDVSSLGVAVFSCANFPTGEHSNYVLLFQRILWADCLQGFFNAYGNSARKDDVDYVIHVRIMFPCNIKSALSGPGCEWHHFDDGRTSDDPESGVRVQQEADHGLARRLHLRICDHDHRPPRPARTRNFHTLRLQTSSRNLPHRP
jgi:hypothetical protein